MCRYLKPKLIVLLFQNNLKVYSCLNHNLNIFGKLMTITIFLILTIFIVNSDLVLRLKLFFFLR